MPGDIFGGGGLIVLVIALVALVIPISALIDSISRPSSAFAAAGSSKGLWIALIVLFWLVTGVVGLILSVVWPRFDLGSGP